MIVEVNWWFGKLGFRHIAFQTMAKAKFHLLLTRRAMQNNETPYDHLMKTQRLVCAAFVHFQRYLDWSDRTKTLESDERKRIGALADIEISSLIATMGQLRRWLIKLARENIALKDIDLPLRSIADLLKDVRDMREHLDDYYSGKGQHRSRFLHRFKSTDGQVYTIPPDWMFHFQGKSYIGGRIALEDLAVALRHAADVLEPVWVLPWKPAELCAVVSGPQNHQ